MLLKVGELAKKSGLTVRTLHHYDSIGLLSPSARSDAGYRLYDRADIARLHAIQAMRQMGLQLGDIAGLLTRPEQSLSTVVRQQINVLDKQIAQASDLRTRLQLLDVRLENGEEPEMSDWFSTLELMSAYGKYFTPAELKKIVKSWKETQIEWEALIRDLKKCMQRSVAPHSPELQPLARRWMALNKLWMGADFDLILKWGRMYESEPLVRSRSSVSPDVVDYIKPAIKLRLDTLHGYFSTEELMGLQENMQEWSALEKKIKDAIKNQVPPAHKKSLSLLKAWSDLLNQTVNHDPELRERLITAFRENDILRASSVLSAPAQQYIQEIRLAHSGKEDPAIDEKRSAAKQ